MIDNDPLIGKQVGTYLIQAKLGEGGMARVYKAYHARLRREVAIKVILPQVADKEGFRERFEREAQVVASLEQRNIVAVYDFGESGNLTYLVMQYVGGGTLRDQLRGERPLDPRRAAAYALQMARALHHAHLRGIVHRDVKPQNMLVSATNTNELLLSDFGIAKLFDSTDIGLTMPSGSVPNNPNLTSADQMVGTAEYMAPEQINRGPVDARADVYALGVVLFQMLTGRAPFTSTTVLGLLYQHVHTPPPPVREVNPQVPEILAQITAKALAKSPAARFQSAEEMAQALEMFLTPNTNPLSASLFNSNATSPMGGPTFPTTSQMFAETSISAHYGPQAQLQAQQGQPPSTQIMSSRQFATDPTTGVSKLAIPSRRSSTLLRPSTFLGLVLVLVVIGGIIWQTHPSWLPGNTSTQSTNIAFAPFSESFQNNDRNWTVGSIGGLSASLNSGKYTLNVSDANTYFPHPATGTLPTNFTYSAQIAQSSGSTSVFYGLAFRLREDGTKVYCYAFIINDSGNYLVLKYDADNANSPVKLTQGPLSAIHTGLNQSNTLQAVVQGSKFSFTINGQSVPNAAITDASYTGGQPALMVAGPNTNFTVTSVKVSSP